MTRSKVALTATAVMLVGSLAACTKPAATAAADTTKLADAVKADADQLVTDFNARDAAKAISHDAPGIVGMFHGAPNLVGPDADLANTKQQMSDPAMKLAVSNEAVDVAASGDLAVYRATYAYTFTDPKTKKPTTETGNWLIGYKPQADGSWKITWDVISDTPSAPPTPAATTSDAASNTATK